MENNDTIKKDIWLKLMPAVSASGPLFWYYVTIIARNPFLMEFHKKK
jgi:hypothetical protein